MDGVVDLPAADALFQSIGAAPGSAPTAPPDNVVLMPAWMWHARFTHAASGAVSTQIHVRLARDLPADPGAAFAEVIGRAKNLEAALAGGGLVGNDLAAQLDGARSDAIYAQMLFLFLGLPGVIIAALLAGVIASSGRDRRRREHALLRVRGASPRRIVRLAAAEAVAVGIVGVGLGLAAATAVGHIAFGTARFGATTGQAVAWAAASVAFGLALAVATIVVPAWRDVRTRSVRDASVTISTGLGRRPVWARAYLDVICLVLGGLIYWQAVRDGYRVVLAPEGVPTISVGYFTLLAPLLFWIGTPLLMWRIGTALLRRGRGWLGVATRPLAHRLAGVVAATMSRQRRSLSRGLVLMGLTASFAISVAIFNTTYASQSRVDAQLSNGADVTVSTAAEAGLPAGISAGGGGAARRRRRPADAAPVRLRRDRPPRPLRDRSGDDRASDGDVRRVLRERQRRSDAAVAPVDAGRGAGIRGDGPRLPAAARRYRQPAPQVPTTTRTTRSDSPTWGSRGSSRRLPATRSSWPTPATWRRRRGRRPRRCC